jgi:anthranilate phosphoribosyltransferase
MMDMPTALQTLLDGQDLQPADMRGLMRTIMSGGATPAQIGAFLIALRAKGESIDEVTAAAEVLREMAIKVSVTGSHVIDTCGTGGDGSRTFNISTTAAFVAAAAGCKVAKHGNRSASGKSGAGSADTLEAAGVNIELRPEQVTRCINEIGVGFLFAQRHHGAMKYTIGPRREIGVRTIFNLLGPLSNPAGATHQLMGVFNRQWVEPLARVLQKLGSKHVLVVHAEDGLDEISIASPTHVAELKDGQISYYDIAPDTFGFTRAPLTKLVAESPAVSLQIMRSVLDGEPGPSADIVALNAGGAIYAADVADSLEAGIDMARSVLASGKGREKLEELVALSRSFT